MRFEEHPSEAGEIDEHEHGGGSVLIAEDVEAALAEYQRCEQAVSLVCFRAANAVLTLDGGSAPQDLARLAAAVKALESD